MRKSINASVTLKEEACMTISVETEKLLKDCHVMHEEKHI
jgi:hypothetical protein